MNDIKVIMCDVDGTLLTSDGIVSPKTIEAIQAVKSKGILFGLCTGRDAHSVNDLLRTWGIAGLVDIIIGNGGSELWDTTMGIKKANYPLAGEVIKEIITHYEDMDVNFAIPDAGELVSFQDDALIKLVSKYDGIPYRIEDKNSFLKESRAKVMIICEADYMKDVIKRSESFHNEQYKSASLVTASVLYEYMDPRVSKANGLKDVLEAHGWDTQHLCTFGDEDNDYDMTQFAGVGVVMENGSEKTKSVADYITDDCDHDGIANFINNYILV